MPKRLWSQEEHNLLQQFVREHVTDKGIKWQNAAEIFPGRTIQQIQNHYNQKLKDNLVQSFKLKQSKIWSYKDMEQLKQAYLSHPRNWSHIQKYFPDVSPENIKNKHYFLMKKDRQYAIQVKQVCQRENYYKFQHTQIQNESQSSEKTNDDQKLYSALQQLLSEMNNELEM